MEEREARIVLNMTEHVGPVRLRQLLRFFETAADILDAPESELRRIPGIGKDTVRAIAQWEKFVDLQGELNRIQKFGCHAVIPSDDEYPALLKEIYDPPIVLYVKGRLEGSLNQSIALVGSRLTTHYGMECARRLAGQLAGLGVTLVSGGARGIDTAAHHGALKAGGLTVAVLGTGINLVFPPENAGLFERITNQGALVTQFPFNRKADKQSFPIRNRIVAGMTLGTVVVEANLTSGALITANMAVDNGRQVFAVPGRIDSPRSKGCHELIKKGAKLCESAEDILSEFEYLFPNARDKSFVAEGRENTDAFDQLSAAETKVLNCLTGEELHIDEIISQCELPPSIVASTLLTLELKHRVKQLSGKRFTRFGSG